MPIFPFLHLVTDREVQCSPSSLDQHPKHCFTKKFQSLLIKLDIGGDVLQNRPTLLRSLANRTDFQPLSVQETYDMFIVQGVFEKAEKLVRQFSDKAHETVQAIDHQPLRELLNQLIAITR